MKLLQRVDVTRFQTAWAVLRGRPVIYRWFVIGEPKEGPLIEVANGMVDVGPCRLMPMEAGATISNCIIDHRELPADPRLFQQTPKSEPMWDGDDDGRGWHPSWPA